MKPDIEDVLVVGGAGYLGSAVTNQLLERGYRVTVMDSLLHGREGIDEALHHDACSLVEADVRDTGAVTRAVERHDAVILLAALVGEPACDKNPTETVSVNVVAAAGVLEACRYYGVQRFLFASTDSCYGIQTGVITEENELNPISLYAETKKHVEERIRAAWELDRHQESPRTGTAPGFGPVVLRMATLFGLSRRMRFDLVLNILTWKASVDGRIPIYGGDQWRPLLHVEDAAAAFVASMEASDDQVLGEVFNVGANDQNVQIKDLGELLTREFPDAETEVIPEPPDLRDYHVDFTKITERIGWRALRSMPDGIQEIQEAIEAGEFGEEILPKYRNA